MEELVYLNGKLLPVSQAKISPFDYGFLYGYGLFETMRAYSGKVFRLTQHLDRLKHSAEFMSLGDKLAKYDLAKAVRDTVQSNNLRDARIRLTVSAGSGDIVPDIESCGEPTVFIVARPYTPLAADIYERGFKACLSSLRRYSTSPLSSLKSCNWLINVMARREAKQAGFDEALLLNEKGQLTEGSASNIFIVSGGVLLTPLLESGILPGVTRVAVWDVAASIGVKVIERQLVQDDLFRADEAFITSSVIEIMPLTKADSRVISSGQPGLITRKIMSAYKDLIRAEIEAK